MPAEFFEPISNNGNPPIYRYFNGKEWRESKSGKRVPVYSPIDNSVVGELQVVTTDKIAEAVAKAGEAQQT